MYSQLSILLMFCFFLILRYQNTDGRNQILWKSATKFGVGRAMRVSGNDPSKNISYFVVRFDVAVVPSDISKNVGSEKGKNIVPMVILSPWMYVVILEDCLLHYPPHVSCLLRYLLKSSSTSNACVYS